MTSPMQDVVGEGLFGRLFDDAERVRWRMDEIPWSELDRARATPGLCELVKAIAFSELTTTTATRRFLTDLADDVDLTQWIAVWFYEETKHPQVLLRWLHAAGVTVDERFIQRGRATAPFMRSKIGTLVTNVISELVASAGYHALWRAAPEPVLARIARHLAADEARHAASFFAFARKELARSRDPDADRRDALKVLYLWFQDSDRVAHPVNEFHGRHAGPGVVGDTLAALGIDRARPRDRACRLVGNLVGLPLDGDSDLLAHVAALGAAPGTRTGSTA